MRFGKNVREERPFIVTQTEQIVTRDSEVLVSYVVVNICC